MSHYALVDSHCHLNMTPLYEQHDDVIHRATEAGIQTFLTISTKSEDFSAITSLIERYPNIYGTVGIHPHEVEKMFEETSLQDLYKVLQQKLEHPKIVGLGETGLDYYYGHSPKEAQCAAFKAHIDVALETKIPLIVHTRDAEEDTIRLLRENGQGKVTGIIHCFTGTQWLAEQALALGFYISVSGIITFKKAESLREIIKMVPLERLLVETDSPYLAPEPYRGKSNESAYMIETVKKLAEVKNITFDDVAKQTTENFLTLFQKVKK